MSKLSEKLGSALEKNGVDTNHQTILNTQRSLFKRDSSKKGKHMETLAQGLVIHGKFLPLLYGYN